ncbi:hypothetical protein [Paenibacillus fonticola]|uniref:hypothetical protein n=1 Tax=Paenibacillus fonticola TaxID=379896 RepID=UPI00037F44B7|nr:hypothetical protein [Paenibacillus fonticola]
MYRLIVCFISVILLAGCSGLAIDHAPTREKDKDPIFVYQLNTIEPDHNDSITNWLEQARNDAEQQKYMYSIQDDQNEYAYEYFYAKGYTDYEVAYIQTGSQEERTGMLHISGLSKTEEGDCFIQIKYLQRYVDSITISDIPISEKLKYDGRASELGTSSDTVSEENDAEAVNNPDLVEDEPLSRLSEEEAISLVESKLDPEQLNFSSFTIYGNDEEGNYIVTQSSKETTEVIEWYHVNPTTREITCELFENQCLE